MAKSKLVRDSIGLHVYHWPKNPENVGFSVRRAGNNNIGFLEDKLLEESKEVLFAKTKTEKLEELADVFEVFRTLVKALDIKMEDVETVANSKKLLKGGFDGGWVLTKENS